MPGSPGGLEKARQNLFDLGDFEINLLEEFFADEAVVSAKPKQSNEVARSRSGRLQRFFALARHLFGQRN